MTRENYFDKIKKAMIDGGGGISFHELLTIDKWDITFLQKEDRVEIFLELFEPTYKEKEIEFDQISLATLEEINGMIDYRIARENQGK